MGMGRKNGWYGWSYGESGPDTFKEKYTNLDDEEFAWAINSPSNEIKGRAISPRDQVKGSTKSPRNAIKGRTQAASTTQNTCKQETVDLHNAIQQAEAKFGAREAQTDERQMSVSELTPVDARTLCITIVRITSGNIGGVLASLKQISFLTHVRTKGVIEVDVVAPSEDRLILISTGNTQSKVLDSVHWYTCI